MDHVPYTVIITVTALLSAITTGRPTRNVIPLILASIQPFKNNSYVYGYCLVYLFVVVLGVLLLCCCTMGVLSLSYVYLLYYVRIVVCSLDAGLLARSQYSEGPATGHLNTGFSWFPCVYKRMLRWFPRFHVATTCFSCSPPDLNVTLLVISFGYLYTCKITTATG
jgi:hypothetical protein